jgi:hypothetical protein
MKSSKNGSGGDTFRGLQARTSFISPPHLVVFDPFGGAKPRLLRWDNEKPLRVNPEQAQAFKPGSRRVDLFARGLLLKRDWLREERDLYGPPMPWRTKPGVLRDWRRTELFRKSFPNW